MLLKIKQAAAVVGLSEYALRRGISEGRFPHIRTGIGKGRILIDVDMLNQYLEQELKDSVKEPKPLLINYGQLRRVCQ